MKSRYYFLATVALVPLGLVAQTLPSGIQRTGNVIMMQPVDEDARLASGRHPGSIRVLSASDRDLYGRAFDAASRGDWVAARSLAAQGRDAMATRILTWRYLLDKNGGANFADIEAFLRSNPEWPLRETLFSRAEQAMKDDLPAQAVIAFFGSRTPNTGIGKVRLGEALIAAGNTTRGRELIRTAWRDSSFEPDQELRIVQRHTSYLSPDIETKRLDNLLWREDLSGARRQLARVGDRDKRIGQVRIALMSTPSSGLRQASELPADMASDPSLLFDRARASRRNGDKETARSLLQRIPAASMAEVHAGKWWGELHINAREGIQDGNYRTAYNLVSGTGLTAGGEFADAEWLAGWLALRFNGEPSKALAHFRKMDKGVSRPISASRAKYWLGRTYEALGDNASAYRQYKLAANYPETFYGQLGLAKIDATPHLVLKDVQPDTTADKVAFESDDLVRAMKVLSDLGEEGLLRVFAAREQELHPGAARIKLLAQFLADAGFRAVSVRVAKNASYTGTNLLAYTHPVISLPSYPGPGAAPEAAYVLGLIRQETEFDSDAVSSAGARGMMQLMPATARRVAQVAGLSYRANDLLTDPNYNIQLGMTELSQRQQEWRGSMILAAAGYNAGPNNAKKWVNQFGDPTSGNVDVIDWIEKVPFSETRNYIQRVLENTQVYRNRLAGKNRPLKIWPDMHIPNNPSLKVLAAPVEAAPSADTDKKKKP